MKKCPNSLIWQAVVDGEEEGAQYTAHLARCPACRAVYRDIREAAELAGRLRCDAALRPDFAAAVLARARSTPAGPFPAGLVAVLLFTMAGAAALLLDPGCWSWWLSVGITRSCSLLMDALFKIIYLGQSFNPACLLLPALLLVLLEIAVLKKLQTVEGC
ncbi:MAG TPA: hypothetical protein GX693_05950 [Firmicutes bacterium]|nr:hypothetical protein [Bacillota bacterium]